MIRLHPRSKRTDTVFPDTTRFRSRAEKGYIIVGQETDGSVTPTDLGMDWIVSKTKDFVGRRSLTRADMASPERKQLVGLLTRDPAEVLPEGAQLVERVLPKTPMPMIGHVTRSEDRRVGQEWISTVRPRR